MDFQVGKKYALTMDTNCVPTYNATYDELTLTGILSYEEAVKQDDIVTKYNAISARKNFNINLKLMTFLKFKTKSNTNIIISKEYIASSTELTTIDLTITITSINSNDITIIRNALENLGYLDASYNQKNL